MKTSYAEIKEIRARIAHIENVVLPSTASSSERAFYNAQIREYKKDIECYYNL